MEPAPPQVSLSVEEDRLLRHFVTTNQRTCWQVWGDSSLFLLPVVCWLITCQVFMRWLPAHLEARGLAICLRHATLRHGVQWFPDDGHSFFELLKGPGAFGTLFGFFAGMIALICYVQQRKARHVAQVLSRILSERSAV